MIQLTISASSLLAVVASALAAYFWYRAAQYKHRAHSTARVVFRIGLNAFLDATPLAEYAQESGKRPKSNSPASRDLRAIVIGARMPVAVPTRPGPREPLRSV
jgi:hypothetical protein